jgi:cobalt-zinc-cadmium efflux system membrane fusion protein
VAESADSYRMRAVTLGAETGEARVVLEGLRAGERIVTSGAFHLNNERRQLAVGGR